MCSFRNLMFAIVYFTDQIRGRWANVGIWDFEVRLYKKGHKY